MVRKGFIKIAEKERERVKLVDCSAEIEAVHDKIVNLIAGILEDSRAKRDS